MMVFDWYAFFSYKKSAKSTRLDTWFNHYDGFLRIKASYGIYLICSLYAYF